jgi:hypothetical protein
MMFNIRNLAAPLLMLMVLLFSHTASAAKASLLTDLQDLNSQASALKTELAGINLSADSVCGPLVNANQSARDLVNSISSINDSLAAPLSVDDDILTSLDDLFVSGLGIANEALRLSVDLNALSTTAQAITLKDGIVAMLQLSNDIGTMADRIGEMADNVLVMSDNIGLMADRILLTQELQNQNVALTMDSILQTQTNALTLVSVVEDATYDLSFATLITEGSLLASRMQTVVLAPRTMDDQLAAIATDVRNFLNDVSLTNDAISADAAANTMVISADAMMQLGNMSLMLTSLATAIDGYVVAVSGLEAYTSDPNLTDSLQSMLQLSADIGVMANRILEMADLILVMADNIGLQADQILLTQQAMNINIATTQAAILAAQEMSIGLIVARSL